MLSDTNKSELFIAVPTPMMEWMKSYHSKLKHPDYTILIPSNLLNPEPVYYYQNFNFESDYSGIEKDSTKPLKKKCKK